jgi:uncharacterized membrane protein HdeD (DUF308 family)
MLNQVETQTAKSTGRQLVLIMGLLVVVAGFITTAQLAVRTAQSPDIAGGVRLVVLVIALAVFSGCVRHSLKSSGAGADR